MKKFIKEIILVMSLFATKAVWAVEASAPAPAQAATQQGSIFLRPEIAEMKIPPYLIAFVGIVMWILGAVLVSYLFLKPVYMWMLHRNLPNDSAQSASIVSVIMWNLIWIVITLLVFFDFNIQIISGVSFTSILLIVAGVLFAIWLVLFLVKSSNN